MVRFIIASFLMFCILSPVTAEEVTYRKHIKPIWDEQCSECHDSSAPYYGEFKENKEKYTGNMGGHMMKGNMMKGSMMSMMKGPRMDTYADLLFFVGWPDSGALMRRLDDGSNTKDHKPGNMYQYLGNSDRERKKNLFQFKAWVGKGAWNLNRWKQRGDVPGITKEQLGKLKVKY